MAYNKAAQKKYAQKCKTVTFRIFPGDSDILDYLESAEEPMSTMIKRLIRAEMRAKGLPVREVGKIADDADDADEE